MKHILQVVWMVAALLGGVACSSDEPTPKDGIVVGLLLPYTGEDATFATSFERAALLAQDAINAAGGIDGTPLVLVAKDTHSDAVEAGFAAEELVRLGARAVIGPEDAEIAIYIAAVLADAQVPLVSPVIGGQNTGSQPWFRLSASAALLGRSLANQLHADQVGDVAVVRARDAYDRSFAESFAQRYQKLGHAVLGPLVLSADAVEAEGVRDAVRESTAAAVVLAAPAVSAAAFVNELGLRDGKPWRFFLSPLLETPVFAQNAFPDLLRDAVGVGVDVVNRDPAFVEQYREAFSETPPDGAFFYYDAVNLVALAIALADAQQDDLYTAISDVAFSNGVQVHWDTVEDGLERAASGQDISYVGLTGTLLFDAFGQQQKAPIKTWRLEDGKVVRDE